jgi:hypothetical protein
MGSLYNFLGVGRDAVLYPVLGPFPDSVSDPDQVPDSIPVPDPVLDLVHGQVSDPIMNMNELFQTVVIHLKNYIDSYREI